MYVENRQYAAPGTREHKRKAGRKTKRDGIGSLR
jgi:hypothetical protein